MALRDDLNQGLRHISNPKAKTPYALNDDDRCVIMVPLPPSVIELKDGRLTIEVRLAPTQNYFSFITPLGVFRKRPSHAFLETLLKRQAYVDHVSAGSFALVDVHSKLSIAVVYHWLLDSVSPETFRAMFARFASTVLDLLRELRAMSQKERSLVLIV